MIELLATSKTITVARCGPKTLAELRAYLTVPVKDQYFASRAKRGWDGTTKFLSAKNTFSRGLWQQVKHWLEECRYKYEIKKVTPNLLVQRQNPVINQQLTLRPNQLEALNRWLRRDGFGIIYAPVAFGKTELAAAALATVKPKRALFLTNSLDLLLQTKERFEQRLPGLQPGLIGGSHWEPRRVTVCTVQTLYNVLKSKDHPRLGELKNLLAETDLVIADECHHSKSTQIRTIIRHAGARYCMGLSARPFHVYDRDLQRMTAEDASILACLGPVVYKESTSELIDQGQLAKPRLLLVPLDHPLADEMPWATARKLLFAHQGLLDTAVALTKAAAEAGQATLVITGNSLAFNRRIHKALVAAGVNAEELHGGVDKEVRQQARLDLNRDGLQAAVATTIFDEGVDIPNLRQLVLAYGGKSLIKLDQRVGRSLRKKQEGANAAVIVEFVSYGNKYLYSHSLTRLKRYMEEKEFELCLMYPERHSRHVRRLLKGRATELNQLPDVNYYRALAAAPEGT